MAHTRKDEDALLEEAKKHGSLKMASIGSPPTSQGDSGTIATPTGPTVAFDMRLAEGRDVDLPHA